MCDFGLNFLGLPDLTCFFCRLAMACGGIFIVNLPFGYLRGAFRKLSFLWLLAIHVPIPFVILIRQFYGLELTIGLAPFLLGSYFLGQFLGRKIYGLIPVRLMK